MMVLFLSAMVIAILVRTLRKDLQFYRDAESGAVEDDDSGWKQVHADVFRPPQKLHLLSALVGTGKQSKAKRKFWKNNCDKRCAVGVLGRSGDIVGFFWRASRREGNAADVCCCAILFEWCFGRND